MSSETRPVLLLIEVELHLPSSNSLKAKRKVIRSLKDRLHNQFNVSIAEISHLDKWQRASLAIAITGKDHAHLEGVIEKIRMKVEDIILGEAIIIGWSVENR